jgi:6-phospho-3-hexuloisomerase
VTVESHGPHLILAELSGVFAHLGPGEIDELARRIPRAGRVVCAGQGRSGLVAAALAVRLLHLGADAHVAGEATCPAVGASDLLIALSRSGTTAITVHQARRAREAGARVAAITVHADSPLADLANLTIAVPESTSRQHAGSLFEQAALVIADSLSVTLQTATEQDDAMLSARHDNLQ